jgi:DNA repair protein RadC
MHVKPAEDHGMERPRERLLALGASALSDAELVAIVLRTGTAGRTALDVAHTLIARFDGVAGFSRRRSAKSQRFTAWAG